jgi:aminocarboxymuconate-semialdehyde decarboxylase
MDQHSINISVISQANPWLDFLSATEAPAVAVEINNDINDMCGKYRGRLFAFGTLPVSAGAEACVREVKRLKELKWMRGVVLGTGGMGQGLDDLNMESVYTALEEAQLPVFLHPHYGLPSQVYGPRADEYGHVLPLAMG